MNFILWNVAGLLALVFLAFGAMKLLLPKQGLAANPKSAWAEQFPPGMIKAIGALEVLAAIGLILPGLIDSISVLVPLAAIGLVLIMIGAAVTHVRRREGQAVGMTLVLLALAAFVAWGRFGPYAF